MKYEYYWLAEIEAFAHCAQLKRVYNKLYHLIWDDYRKINMDQKGMYVFSNIVNIWIENIEKVDQLGQRFSRFLLRFLKLEFNCQNRQRKSKSVSNNDSFDFSLSIDR